MFCFQRDGRSIISARDSGSDVSLEKALPDLKLLTL